MKYILIIVLAIVVGLTSCKPAKEVSKAESKKTEKKKETKQQDTLTMSVGTIEKYVLDAEKMKSMQYYLKGNIELYSKNPADTLSVSLSSKVDESGKLLVGKKGNTPDIVIPSGTPCIVASVEGIDIFVQFSTDKEKQIKFMPHLTDSIYYPLGKLSKKIYYGGQVMYISEESLNARFVFLKDNLPQTSNSQTESGVTIFQKDALPEGSGVQKKSGNNGEFGNFSIPGSSGQQQTQQEQKQETKPANQNQQPKKGADRFDLP